MNNRFLLVSVILATAVMAQAPDQSMAQDDQYAAVKDKLQTCVACHGENGASTQPQYPILAGQHLHYLYVQLKDFKSGLRKNEIMGPITATLEKADMLAIAEYFSEQSWPNIGFNGDPEKVGRGEQATVAGQCVQCHLGGYEGDSGVPRLAGQYPQYLQKTMLDFKNKLRTNSPAKSSLMESYSAEDLAGMAHFLGER
jgi:cytochrome c553